MKAWSKTERKNSALIMTVDKKKEMREEGRVGGKEGMKKYIWHNTRCYTLWELALSPIQWWLKFFSKHLEHVSDNRHSDLMASRFFYFSQEIKINVIMSRCTGFGSMES